MARIFKPRRGKKSTMAGASKASTVLAAGEMFLEVPDEGVGKGASRIKIGDGTTAYSSLPYALGDTDNFKLTLASNSSTTIATALNDVAIGKTVAQSIAALKQGLSLANTAITQLNDDLTKKQDTISGGASTITSSNLTDNRALISNSSGKVAVSAVTSTELGYLDGVTSNIQTQLNGKANSSHNHDTVYLSKSKITLDGTTLTIDLD